MPAVKSLADGKVKLAILTTKPTNPAAPTLVELNAGIDAACSILSSDFALRATDSEKIAEKALCVENNANALGPGNYEAGLSVFRFFDGTTLAPDATADALFAALKLKGTTTWWYARMTGKKSTAPWAASDEIYLGAEVLTDTPQAPSEMSGYIKYRIPGEVQAAWPFTAVPAA